MTFLQAAILGIIQGITEMMPISSSTHLVVFSQLQGLPNQRMSFDIFLNIGTLLAICIFFHQQIFSLIRGGLNLLTNEKTQNRDFVLTLIFANVPTIVIFSLLDALFDVNIKSTPFIAAMIVIFAFVLWFCDKRPDNCDTSAEKDAISRKDAMLVGLAQLLSIFPGVSRLGICYSTMRYLDYSRSESFRFSMLMSLIPITGACIMKLINVFTGKIIIDDWCLICVGCLCSCLFGIASLLFMTAFLKRHSMLLFVIYRVIFGILLIL